MSRSICKEEGKHSWHLLNIFFCCINTRGSFKSLTFVFIIRSSLTFLPKFITSQIHGFSMKLYNCQFPNKSRLHWSPPGQQWPLVLRQLCGTHCAPCCCPQKSMFQFLSVTLKSKSSDYSRESNSTRWPPPRFYFFHQLSSVDRLGGGHTLKDSVIGRVEL